MKSGNIERLLVCEMLIMENDTQESVDSPISEQPIQLPLSDNGEQILFASPSDLQDYITIESNSWSWLQSKQLPYGQNIRNHLEGLMKAFALNLNSILQHWKADNPSALEAEIQALIEVQAAWNIPSSQSAIGKFIHNYSEDNIALAAQMLLISLAPNLNHPAYRQVENVYRNYEHIVSSGQLQQVSAITGKAAVLLSQFHLFAQVEGSSGWKQHAQDMVSALSNEKNTAESECTAFKAWIQQEQKLYDSLKEDSERKVREHFRRFARESLTENTRRQQEAEREKAEALNNLAAAEEAYRTKIDLDESVGYWDTKKSEHDTERKKWIKRIGWGVGLTAATPIMLLLTQAVFKHLEWIDASNYLFKTIHPSFAFFSILAVSLGSYVIRFCSQQYQSQQHLYLEAVERRTMIKTYLALLSENRLNGHEDRKVALDTLFRPGQTGIVSESSPILPTEQVVKVMGSQIKPT